MMILQEDCFDSRAGLLVFLLSLIESTQTYWLAERYDIPCEHFAMHRSIAKLPAKFPFFPSPQLPAFVNSDCLPIFLLGSSSSNSFNAQLHQLSKYTIQPKEHLQHVLSCLWTFPRGPGLLDPQCPPLLLHTSTS
ncbi:uncharacterized protein BKA55DRAFT_587559 [Fusarium redolens]|uniref:Uncharacterized protein n=1 Tax=Fusarium redolens TaxID=48865 RepID=A0A9P9FV71_FUSRE|nr:uncharacterized protein BKA55DRAFT_587559 [Fusarium redolens]KAH7203091.1 hypothetical protein BKA55DRAFT_587559 [Fusarium redolens]